MLGRVRAPSSSPDSLERSTTKLLKHDSLSVYEATLLKLKQGSQQIQGSPTSEFVQPDDYSAGSSSCEDAMNMECDCSCPNPSHSQLTLLHEKNLITVNDACILSSTSDAHAMVSLKQRSKGEVSILHLGITCLSETWNKNVSAPEQ
ncbi:uncharacterized protein LOC115749473 isoform X2 [Rhodamnia argentea]|uniref:Uncharacterized protein LOC115749473 isoform X2 n=1 Tax=Rhodamnia argentea TaxID=178133 RepID=A0ABM3HQ45_9MYRT|nr:uncharacterized protein LOC115749473 isoform X2 [Rhodamnia argentea]